MESDGENLDNIFDEYENAENDAGNTENGQTTNETSNAIKIAAPKRIVRNPRLKFNPERLCGERGIPVLVDHFKNTKFKGAGHEKEDLDKLMSKLEHWTHRLFPSMKFEDCLNHIEKLGKKRPVQTCLRKIRLDMPILSSDFVKDDDDDDVQRNDDPEPEEVDAFDRLLGESRDVLNPNISTTESVPDSSPFYFSPASNHTSGHVLGSSFGSSISDEQKERMERNRLLAAERRKARLAALQQNSMESQSANGDVIPSQNISNVQDSFDTLLSSSLTDKETPQHNKSVIGSVKESSTELNDENSELLGLDDLIDLVDEEEPAANKDSAGFSSEQSEVSVSNLNNPDKFSRKITDEVINCSAFEQQNNVIVSNSVDDEAALHLNSSTTVNEENLEMDSLLDLADEDSKHYQQNSEKSSVVKNVVISEDDEEVLMAGEEEEEPAASKNSIVLSSEQSEVCFSNLNNPDKFSHIITDEIINCSNFEKPNNVIVSNSVDDEATLHLESSATVNEENLEMDSLLDLVDEDSKDYQQNSEKSSVVKNVVISEDDEVLMAGEEEEEPAASKDSVVLSSEQSEVSFSNLNNPDKFSHKITDEIINCSNFEKPNNVIVSNSVDDEAILHLKSSATVNEENLEMDSLLDLVDEDSKDYQQNSEKSSLVKNVVTSEYDEEASMPSEEVISMDF